MSNLFSLDEVAFIKYYKNETKVLFFNDRISLYYKAQRRKLCPYNI